MSEVKGDDTMSDVRGDRARDSRLTFSHRCQPQPSSSPQTWPQETLSWLHRTFCDRVGNKSSKVSEDVGIGEGDSSSSTHLDLALAAAAVLGCQKDARRAALALVTRVRRLRVTARRRRSSARVGAGKMSTARDRRVDNGASTVADELVV